MTVDKSRSSREDTSFAGHPKGPANNSAEDNRQGPWVKVPAAAIYDEGLTAHEFRTLAVLCHLSSYKTGVLLASMSRIAVRCRKSASQAKRDVKAIILHGYLKSRKRGNRVGGGNTSSVRTIQFPPFRWKGNAQNKAGESAPDNDVMRAPGARDATGSGSHDEPHRGACDAPLNQNHIQLPLQMDEGLPTVAPSDRSGLRTANSQDVGAGSPPKSTARSVSTKALGKSLKQATPDDTLGRIVERLETICGRESAWRFLQSLSEAALSDLQERQRGYRLFDAELEQLVRSWMNGRAGAGH